MSCGICVTALTASSLCRILNVAATEGCPSPRLGVTEVTAQSWETKERRKINLMSSAMPLMRH